MKRKVPRVKALWTPRFITWLGRGAFVAGICLAIAGIGVHEFLNAKLHEASRATYIDESVRLRIEAQLLPDTQPWRAIASGKPLFYFIAGFALARLLFPVFHRQLERNKDRIVESIIYRGRKGDYTKELANAHLYSQPAIPLIIFFVIGALIDSDFFLANFGYIAAFTQYRPIMQDIYTRAQDRIAAEQALPHPGD